MFSFFAIDTLKYFDGYVCLFVNKRTFFSYKLSVRHRIRVEYKWNKKLFKKSENSLKKTCDLWCLSGNYYVDFTQFSMKMWDTFYNNFV